MISIDKTKQCQEVNISIKADELELLFASGIVNPNGPTLNVFYSEPTTKANTTLLYQITLHPISDSIQHIATVKWGKEGRDIIGIEFFSDFFNGSLPTLFMKGNMLNNELYEQIIVRYIETSTDSLKTYRYIKEYEGKPIQRVSAEMRGAYDSILGKKTEEKPIGFLSKLFGKKKVDVNSVDKMDFIKVLTKDVNVIEEVRAFLMAYKGSIDNIIPEGMVQMDFKSFLSVFTHVALQCSVDLSKLKK